MLISQPNNQVIGSICANGSAKHTYETLVSHYNCDEFVKGVERFKSTLDIESMTKRLTKFLALTSTSNAYIYLGKMSLFNNFSIFDVFLNKEGHIVWGGTGYNSPLSNSKTLSNVNQSSVSIWFANNNEINYDYQDVKIAKYNINEDTIEILKPERIDIINNFNSFLTQYCNKTLRVAVAIEDTVEIMEISY